LPEIDLARGHCFEELEIGDRFDCGSVTLTETHLVTACQLFQDFHPLHTDAGFASTTRYQGRIFPGMFTAGLVVGAISRISGRNGLTHGEDHVRYLAAVSPGDTLHIYITVEKKEQKGQIGVVSYRHEAHNQHGEKVIEILTTIGHRLAGSQGK
jgi:3-hydroxybutyryl-CoA dehydratase